MAPSTSKEFSWFYTLKSNQGALGFFYFAKQVVKGVQAITKIKESLGNWKDAFFFTPVVDIKGCFGSPSKLSSYFFP